MSWHASRDRMDGEFHAHTAIDQQLAQLPDLVLGLGHGHAVPGHDDDLVGIGHQDTGIGRFDRFERAAAFSDAGRLAGCSEITEQHVGDRPIHGLGHELGQQGTGRADYGTGDDHRCIVEHITFECHGQTRQGVIERDHHRHIGTADR